MAATILRPRQFAGTLARRRGVEPRNDRPARRRSVRRFDGGSHMNGKSMIAKHVGIALAVPLCAILGAAALAAPALAQNEQFIPPLLYCTGPSAPHRAPFASRLA